MFFSFALELIRVRVFFGIDLPCKPKFWSGINIKPSSRVFICTTNISYKSHCISILRNEEVEELFKIERKKITVALAYLDTDHSESELTVHFCNSYYILYVVAWKYQTFKVRVSVGLGHSFPSTNIIYHTTSYHITFITKRNIFWKQMMVWTIEIRHENRTMCLYEQIKNDGLV